MGQQQEAHWSKEPVNKIDIAALMIQSNNRLGKVAAAVATIFWSSIRLQIFGRDMESTCRLGPAYNPNDYSLCPSTHRY